MVAPRLRNSTVSPPRMPQLIRKSFPRAQRAVTESQSSNSGCAGAHGGSGISATLEGGRAARRPRASLVPAERPMQRASDPQAPGESTPLHVLDARQFARQWLEDTLFPAARMLQQTPVGALPQSLVGKRLFYLFYEPSTRTRVSFETAVTLLGGQVMGMDSHEQQSRDERLEDRIQVLNQFPYDFILLRYHEEGGARRAADVSRVPIINAGDGTSQHPTQALLDAYTIWQELGRI